MYTIKQSPEEFIVEEIAHHTVKDSGSYAICSLRKTNYTTLRALEALASVMGKELKDFGFAGTKDKHAITEQYISIKNCSKDKAESVRLKDIELNFLGFSDSPISLGFLEGNEFFIIVRNVTPADIEGMKKKEKIMPNYFGEQRFSKNNHTIGKHLVKGEFKEAYPLIRESVDYLLPDTPDIVGSLKKIPRHLLMMYIHAYQSLLWNRTLKKYASLSKRNIDIPLIGFGMETDDPFLDKILKEIMEKEGITPRNFVNRSFPELSAEGGIRKAFTEIKDFSIEEEDPLQVHFILEKGCYGTIALAYLLNQLDNVLHDFV